MASTDGQSESLESADGHGGTLHSFHASTTKAEVLAGVSSDEVDEVGPGETPDMKCRANCNGRKHDSHTIMISA